MNLRNAIDGCHWHVIYKVGRKIAQTDFHFKEKKTLEQAEAAFRAAFPDATYWEIGTDGNNA